MTTLLIIIHILVCFFLIGIVLLQHGKGADIGATFGGSSQSLFGTEGPLPLLNKITTLAAIVFMGTSITLAYLSANRSTGTVMEEVKIETPLQQQAPSEPIVVPAPEPQVEPSTAPQEMPLEQTPSQQQAPSEPIVIPAPEAQGEPSAVPQDMPLERSSQ
ncbi:MAG: preprotein translocase subunit SecG [Desulfobulbaceae bacterium]|jgi:preprotein translocase subunit SecG|nr:preprotein translocase subunit SecG [Desulfobulbaceae bacterium]